MTLIHILEHTSLGELRNCTKICKRVIFYEIFPCFNLYEYNSLEEKAEVVKLSLCYISFSNVSAFFEGN